MLSSLFIVFAAAVATKNRAVLCPVQGEQQTGGLGWRARRS